MGMPIITTSNIDRCDAVTDIIQSVALQQAALSHILNAEGEKIQKIVGLETVSPELLLETNKSVRSMVESISQLEMIFHSKLGLFENCLCDCTKKCTAVVSTSLTSEGENVRITKVDDNTYSVTVTTEDLPAEITVATVPDVPVVALLLQNGMTFEDNVLRVTSTIGPVVLMAGVGDCAQIIKITFSIIS